jgi:hypothetical protein
MPPSQIQCLCTKIPCDSVGRGREASVLELTLIFPRLDSIYEIHLARKIIE